MLCSRLGLMKKPANKGKMSGSILYILITLVFQTRLQFPHSLSEESANPKTGTILRKREDALSASACIMSGMEKISVSRKLELDGLVLRTTKHLYFFSGKNTIKQKPPVTPI